MQKIKWTIVGTLKGHSLGVVTVPISFDATRVVSGSTDGSIRLWDTKTRTCLGVMSGTNPHGYLELVFCPKVKRMVPEELLISRIITSVAISHDVSRIVDTLSDTDSGFTMTESDLTVLTWAVPENPTPPRSITHLPLHGHTDLVTTACFHPHDRNNVISGSRDGSIRIWSISGCLSNNTCLAKIRISGAPVLRALYSPNTEVITTHGSNSIVHLFATPQFPFRVHHPRHLGGE
jgi:WD40 repeat protein